MNNQPEISDAAIEAARKELEPYRPLGHYVQLAINSETEKLRKENERLFDLVRYQRAELHQANLITDDEYIWLCSDDPRSDTSRQRLEAYDQLRQQVGILEKHVSDPQEALRCGLQEAFLRNECERLRQQLALATKDKERLDNWEKLHLCVECVNSDITGHAWRSRGLICSNLRQAIDAAITAEKGEMK